MDCKSINRQKTYRRYRQHHTESKKKTQVYIVDGDVVVVFYDDVFHRCHRNKAKKEYHIDLNYCHSKINLLINSAKEFAEYTFLFQHFHQNKKKFHSICNTLNFKIRRRQKCFVLYPSTRFAFQIRIIFTI